MLGDLAVSILATWDPLDAGSRQLARLSSVPVIPRFQLLIPAGCLDTTSGTFQQTEPAYSVNEGRKLVGPPGVEPGTN